MLIFFKILIFLYFYFSFSPLNAEESFVKITSDQVIYKKKEGYIEAIGNVKILYKTMVLQADKIIYNQKTKKISAFGNIVFKPSPEETLHANYLDLTDKFENIFAKNLYIETPEKGYFYANALHQKENSKIYLKNASYTACSSCKAPQKCKENSKKPWKIVANEIIWDKNLKNISFKNSQFQLFDIPVFWLPFFQISDPTVSQKTGFLAPRLFSKSYLGIGLKIPFFINLSPFFNLTLVNTPLTSQGLLTEAIWRQKLSKGLQNIHFAYIHQNHPDRFEIDSIDHFKKDRFFLSLNGSKKISDFWDLYWDIFMQSDKNFARTYNLQSFGNQEERDSKILLTGLKNNNYFQFAFHHFHIQESILNSSSLARDPFEPYVFPEIFYEKRSNSSFFNTILDIKFYTASLYFPNSGNYFGNKNFEKHFSNYASLDLDWKKRFISSNGFVITPGLNVALKDHYFQTNKFQTNQLTALPTGKIEISYPLLIKDNLSYSILEPLGQIFVSGYENKNFYKNNDIFYNIPMITATNLFHQNRFLSPNFIEGGTRLNAGVRYYRPMQGEWYFSSLIGQSLLLSGLDYFSPPQNLEFQKISKPKFSDIVGFAELRNENLFSISLDANFRVDNKSLRRIETNFSKEWQNFQLNLFYTHGENPYNNFPNNPFNYKTMQEIGAESELHFNQNWSISLGTNYNLKEKILTNLGSQLHYNNDCLGFNLGYQKNQTLYDQKTAHSFKFSVSLKNFTQKKQSEKTYLLDD